MWTVETGRNLHPANNNANTLTKLLTCQTNFLQHHRVEADCYSWVCGVMIFIEFIITACIHPEIPYHFEGSFHDHGWISVNQSIIYECSDEREFEARCTSDNDSDSFHGVWEPEIFCPSMSG